MLKILDAQRSDRRYLTGDLFTMGDIPSAVAVHRWYELDIRHPELLRCWYQAMRQRGAFQTVVMTPMS